MLGKNRNHEPILAKADEKKLVAKTFEVASFELRGDNKPVATRAGFLATPLREHLVDVVAVTWRQHGFNASLGLPFEAVTPLDVPTPVRYRAMACARQLFIFSEQNDQEHADRLFTSLIQYFRDDEHGGFHYSVDPDGNPLETDKDLYTHAFVIFACASYYARFQRPEARAVLEETTAIVVNRFSIDPATGLSNAAVSHDFGIVRVGARQNPLMHLTEAYLAAREATGNTDYDTLLEALLAGISAHFVDTATGCIMELPANDPKSWIEPGHQFEWFYLMQQSGHEAFQHAGLVKTLATAFVFAKTHGVDPITGGVAATLDRAGNIQDANQRIWAQTEYLRAIACHPDKNVRSELPSQISAFASRFLHDKGWHECLSADGQVTRSDMPSTTPYHLLSAYLALP